MTRSVFKRTGKSRKAKSIPRNIQPISGWVSETKTLASPPSHTVSTAGEDVVNDSIIYFNEEGVFRIGKVIGPLCAETISSIPCFHERKKEATSLKAGKRTKAFKWALWCVEGILECDSVSVHSTCEIMNCIWIMDALTLNSWISNPAQTSFRRDDIKEVFAKSDTRKKGARPASIIRDLRRVIGGD